MIELFNEDCMEVMKRYPDGYFSLACVDPPYGLGDKLTSGGTTKGWANRVQSGAEKWDISPPPEYFKELFRVSQNQIIWGANHFILPVSRGIIAWDKIKSHDKNSSHWEYAWTSFDMIAKMFRYCNNGGFVAKEAKIHPCEKPIALYSWLLKNYAKPGDRILDTHGGSMSIAIACYNMGFDLTLCELDEDYYNAGVKRFEDHKRQGRLFEP